MRICLDVDGVICYTKKDTESYSELEPIPGSVETIKELKTAGHYIIIATARHMKTCNNNPGLVVARQGKTLIDWLEKYQIPYDELWFGKPLADLYVDDHAHKFIDWKQVRKEVIND